MRKIHLIPHAMVERFGLPESLPGAAQDQVGISCRGSFQPPCNRRQRSLGTQQGMHVIGHDDPCSEVVELPPTRAVEKGVGHHSCGASIPEPGRAEGGFVRLPVQGEKCKARGRLRRSSFRHRAGQTPRNEQERRFGDIGMPVGRFAAVEHKRLAGDSPCATDGDLHA